jgi:hypothetical protein
MADLQIISINKSRKTSSVAEPEIPKPITWQYLKEKSLKQITWFTNKHGAQGAKAGLNELEKEIKQRFPEMITHAFVANRDDWYIADKKFRKVRTAMRKDKSVAKRCHDAYSAVEITLRGLHWIDYELKNAFDSTHLTALQLLCCINKWLRKNKWEASFPLEPWPKQLEAIKNKKKMVVIPIASFDILYSKPEQRMGEAFINALKIKIREPHTLVALAVSDDNETHKPFMPYWQTFLKSGIRIFMVKAPDKVTELKK